jgi:hypothetical protein
MDEITRYQPGDHVRDHLTEAADEGASYITKLLRGAIENTKENRALAAEARAALGAFTRYEATLSAREQTSVMVSRMLAGDNAEDFQRYIKASMPDHAAVRMIDLRLPSGDADAA